MADYALMKAILTDRAFSDRNWVFERKLDRIRCGVIRREGRVRLVSRSGETLTGGYPELVEALGTRDGMLRHPRFEGLREDKPAREVVREEPQ